MNKRIEELAEQANAWYPMGYPSGGGSLLFCARDDAAWENLVIFEKEDLEKFAELIVRECADIALREEHDPYECIKKHFGIKE